MSFYSDASLVMIPSGYKTSKVYSAVPTDGAGDLSFTRTADTATRVGPDGLIEKVRTNLLLQSNSFDTGWSLTSGSSVTSGESGYDGSSDAWLLSDSGNNFAYCIYRGYANTGVETFSIYAKQASTSQIEFDFLGGSNGYLRVNLTDGSLHSTINTIDYNIEDAGSGWWRCSFSANNTSATTLVRIGCNGAGTIYIQDAQVEAGDIATDYIATTSAAVSVGPVANVPRLDYLGSSCPRLLLEPQRTNLLPQSNYFAAADWVKINTSVTTNQATSPEGIANASALTENTSSGFHVTYDSIGAAFSTAHTLSAFVKPNGRSIIYLRMENASTGGGLGITYFNVSTGQILTDSSTSSSIEAYANGWYRVIITATTPAAAFTLFSIGLADADNSRSYTGNGVSGIYLYGAQAEPSATYATSYIPTLGAAVTRGADAASKTGISSLINSAEGTLFTEISCLSNGGPSRRISLSDGSTSNRVSLELDEDASTFKGFMSSGGTLVATFEFVGIDQTENLKIALTYSASAFSLFINGVKRDTDTSIAATPIGLDRLRYANATGTLDFEGTQKQLLIFPTALSDADAIALTA